MSSSGRMANADGAIKLCPRCRGTLVFRNQHPTLTVGVLLELNGCETADRIRYEQVWVCANGACDYRELVGGA
jgi:hypothetical protein